MDFLNNKKYREQYNKFKQITVKMAHIHNCYFHETNQITHFCKRLNCTLPMCQKCLPIHIQQHGAPNQNQGVISFPEALDYAVQTLKNNLLSQSKNKNQFMNKIQESRTRVMRIIDQIFARFRIKLDQEFSKVAEVEKRLMKIQKGSLKTLIYFYSDQQKQINGSMIEQIISRAQRIEKACRASIEQEQKNYSLRVEQRTDKHITNSVEVVNTVNTVHTINTNHTNNINTNHRERQRGYSFDNLHSLNNIKSSANLRAEAVTKMSYNMDADKKLSNNKSMKVLHKDYSQVEGYNYRNSNQKTQSISSQNFQAKFDSDTDRQKQIQRIRVRQEERQRQKLREKQREIQIQRQRQRELENEKQRERQRQRQRQRQRERERQRQREREKERQREAQRIKQKQRQREREQQRQRERQKERQRQINKACQRQFLKIKQTSAMIERSKQSSGRQFNQNFFYQNNNYLDVGIGRHETRSYNVSIQKQNMGSKVQHESYKRPLQVADLNIQSKASSYKYQQYNKDDRKITICDNGLEMNKEVLAPEQIRRMLQKRIEQRSRLISKNRTFTSKQSQQYKGSSKSLNKRQIITNNFVIESEAKWDTKDSIINQIYD